MYMRSGNLVSGTNVLECCNSAAYWGKAMKTFVSMVALAVAIAVTGPAFAQDAAKATDKASCDKAGGTWDDAAKKCNPKQ